jgi:nucleotide-binding universal stress UspA family protein
MTGFRQIVVGWDGSRDARQALRQAVHLAEDLRAEVQVVAVLRRHVHAEAIDEAASELRGRRLETMAAVAEEAAHQHVPSALAFRVEVLEAEDVAGALSAYAREHGSDLVVVGRHGLDRAVHPRAGRVAEYMVRHSPCPVMVIGGD